MQNILCSAILFLLLISCSNNAIVKGVFLNVPDSVNVELSVMDPSHISIIDKTPQHAAQFEYTIPFAKDTTPLFCKIKMGNKHIVILARPKEQINLSGNWDHISRYAVTGSKGSEIVMNFNRQIDSITKKVDSIFQLVLENKAEEKAMRLLINQAYVRQKQICTRFVVTHIHTYESLAGIYQKFGNEFSVFNDFRDIILLRNLQSQIATNYPKSPYIKLLSQNIAQIEWQERLIEMPEVSFPEINLPDSSQNNHQLSSLQGKLFILYFNDAQPKSRIQTREFIELHKKYKALNIYQVFLGNNVEQWKNILAETPVPWTNVIETAGLQSTLIGLYNIQQLPTYYLIDKKGNIVGKNFSFEELEVNIKKLI